MTKTDWEDLLPDLLEPVLNRLPVPDYLRFAAVCKSWNRIQRNHHLGRAPTFINCGQMPWLMLPNFLPSQQKRVFYSPSEQRYYTLPFPEESERYTYCSTSHGWLFFLPGESKCMFLDLINPVTGSKITIPIPPRMLKWKFTVLGELSSSPTNPDCMVILRTLLSYFYCRISDKKWKTLTIPMEFRCCRFPVTPLFRGGKLYIDDLASSLIAVEPLSLPFVTSIDLVDQLYRPYSRKFFVEYDGHILLVRLSWEWDKIKRIEIFQVDLTRKIWVRLESLKDHVMFLDVEHSICLPAVNTGCLGNRIYYTNRYSSSKRSQHIPLWIEYDYESHQIVSSEMQTFLEDVPESSSGGCLHWMVPSLC